MTREYINPPGVPQRVHYTRVLKIDKPSNLLQLPAITNSWLQNWRFSAPTTSIS